MKEIDSDLLKEAVQRIVARLHPERIYLYGSHAYGQPHDNSDVDLLNPIYLLTREPLKLIALCGGFFCQQRSR